MPNSFIDKLRQFSNSDKLRQFSNSLMENPQRMLAGPGVAVWMAAEDQGAISNYLGDTYDSLSSLYRKYAPAPVQDAGDYWANTPDPIPGPSPDDPFKLASIIIPSLIMKGGKYSKRMKEIVESKLGTADFSKVPYKRWQHEAVDIPVSQGNRGGVFVTPKIGHGRVDPNMYRKGPSPIVNTGAEGGDHLVEGTANLKNPLFIDRDIKTESGDMAKEYIGERLIRQFLGEGDRRALDTFLDPNTAWQINRGHLPPDTLKRIETAKIRAQQIVNRLFTPKESKQLLKQPVQQLVVEEAIGNRLVQRAGYDSVVNLRKFTQQQPVSEATNFYAQRKLAPMGSRGPRFGLANPPKEIDGEKARLIQTAYKEHKGELRDFAGAMFSENKNNYLSPAQYRLLDKAWRSKDAHKISDYDINRITGAGYLDDFTKSLNDIAEAPNTPYSFMKTFDKFMAKRKKSGYNATQLVLLDPDLQKEGLKALRKKSIDDLLQQTPDFQNAAMAGKEDVWLDGVKWPDWLNMAKPTPIPPAISPPNALPKDMWPSAMTYLNDLSKDPAKGNNTLNLFMNLPNTYKDQAEAIIKKQGSIDPHILYVWANKK